MRAHGRSPASWLLVIVTGVVVAAFVGAHLFSRSQAKDIDRYALDIATNGAPRIQHLASAQAIISNMQTSTALALRDAIHGRPFDRSFFAQDDAALHTELSTYLALAAYPGERAAYGAVDQNIDAFERTVDQVLALLERGDMLRAADMGRTHMRAGFRGATDALRELISLNAAHIADESELLMSVRRRTATSAGILHTLAALLALVLMGLAVRLMRERARLDQERQRFAEARAEELERFAVRLAHDLRGPLSALSLRVAQAARHAEGAIYGKLSQQIRTMSALIDGLLAFAMAGGRPAPSTAELSTVLGDVVASAQAEAQVVGATLTVDAIPSLTVACSPGELTSVLSNLLGNAVKYVVAGTGDRRIGVRAMRSGGRVRVDVIDTGPGIPAGREREVFEPLVRIIGSSGAQGLGLGLATVKRLVEARGGVVGVESVPGHGSRFWFELPLAAGRPPRADGPATPAQQVH